MTGNVYDISSGKPVEIVNEVPIPVQDFGGWMSWFIENHLGDFQSAAESLLNANDEQEFRYYKAEIERIVRGWPT
jgi:hypothetical protein